MKHAFAPHLAGRMLPGLFSYFVGRKPRFPGDPWPEQVPARRIVHFAARVTVAKIQRHQPNETLS